MASRNKQRNNQRPRANSAGKDSPTPESEDIFNFGALSQKLTQIGKIGSDLPKEVGSSFNVLADAVRMMAACMQDISKTLDLQAKTHAELLQESKNQTSKIETLITEINNCKIENQSLRAENENLSRKVNDLEQYSLNFNLVIEGVPQQPGENVYDIVVKTANAVGAHISRENIENCHRLNKRVNSLKPPSIIAKFFSRQIKESILEAKKGKQLLKAADIGFKSNNNIYIQEHLTAVNRNLFWLARNARNQLGYQFAWCRRGQVFLRKDEHASVIRVVKPADIPVH